MASLHNQIHWAFKVEGERAVAGLLFGGIPCWGRDTVAETRLNYLEQTFYAKRKKPRWQRINPDQAKEYARSSELAVLMANPDDHSSIKAASEFAAEFGGQGTLAVLFATKPDLGSIRGKRRSVSSKNRRGTAPFCLLRTEHSFDPPMQLNAFIKPFALGWEGLIGVDFTDVREVITPGKSGWYVSGVSHGANRAYEAASHAITLAQNAGVPLGGIETALVTITAGGIKLAELRKVKYVVHTNLGADTSVLLAHQWDYQDETFLTVELLLTAQLGGP